MGLNFTGTAAQMARSVVYLMDDRACSRRMRKKGLRMAVCDEEDAKTDAELLAYEARENEFIFDWCEVLVILRDQCGVRIDIHTVEKLMDYDVLRMVCEDGGRIAHLSESRRMLEHLFCIGNEDSEENRMAFIYKTMMPIMALYSFKKSPFFWYLE